MLAQYIITSQKVVVSMYTYPWDRDQTLAHNVINAAAAQSGHYQLLAPGDLLWTGIATSMPRMSGTHLKTQHSTEKLSIYKELEAQHIFVDVIDVSHSCTQDAYHTWHYFDDVIQLCNTNEMFIN